MERKERKEREGKTNAKTKDVETEVGKNDETKKPVQRQALPSLQVSRVGLSRRMQ